jgi:hypothetical protein
MGLFNGKNKDGNLKIQMVHMQGLPHYVEKAWLYVTLDSNNQQVTFKGINKNDTEINLPFSKITAIGTTSEEVIKENSGTGRAIAGGLLFGAAGAVVGAVTARDKKKQIFYKVINYISNDEEKSIVLGTRGDINEMKFFRNLAESIPQQNKPTSVDL